MNKPHTLHPASYNGVTFYVDTADSEVGRRTQVHEYPKQDKPYVEDLGRKARRFELNAFVIGANYMTQRDNLISEIEKRGSGRLSHPYLGILTVSIVRCKISESNKHGGMAKFSLHCVESGDYQFPKALIDKKQTVRDAAINVDMSAQQDFINSIDLSGNSLIRSDFNKTLDNMLGIKRGSSIDALAQQIMSLPTLPDNAYIAHKPGFASKMRRQINGNNAALTRLIDTAKVTREIHGLVDSLPLSPLVDAVTTRNRLASNLDKLAKTVTSNYHYQSVTSLKSATVTLLDEQSVTLPLRKRINTQQALPALVVAYNDYEDASKEQEVIALNKIAHPGFTQPGNIAVVSHV